MAVVISEAERRLRVHGVADHIRVRQHARRVLLEGVRAELQGQCQRIRAVEVLLPQLHDFETGVYVGQFNHGGVVKEEVLGREILVAGAFEPFSLDVEDFDAHAAGAGFGVWLDEDGLIGVACGDGVGARVGEEALREVVREAGGDGQGAFHQALGFDVGRAKSVTMLAVVSAGVECV